MRVVATLALCGMSVCACGSADDGAGAAPPATSSQVPKPVAITPEVAEAAIAALRADPLVTGALGTDWTVIGAPDPVVNDANGAVMAIVVRTPAPVALPAGMPGWKSTDEGDTGPAELTLSDAESEPSSYFNIFVAVDHSVVFLVPFPDEFGDRRAAEAAAASTAPPATALMTMPPPATGPYVGPAPAPVDEPCPMTADVQIDGSSLAETSRLEPMLGQVLAYGQEHPDVFGQHGLLWNASDDASVFASFVGPLDAHRAALADLVEFPDELVVCQVALSGGDSQRFISALTSEYSSRIQMAGFNGSTIDVGLAPTEVALAEELHARYGDALTITVGALRYPIDLADDACIDDATGDAPPPGIELSITQPTAPLSVASAAEWGLEATITNVGTEHVSSTSGIATGVLLDASGRVVSSNAPVAVAAIGYSVELDPGRSATVPIMVLPNSCRVELGYTLPPGEYQLVATVQHSVIGQPVLQMLTPPTPVTLVA